MYEEDYLLEDIYEDDDVDYYDDEVVCVRRPVRFIVQKPKDGKQGKVIAVEYDHRCDGMDLILRRYPWADIDFICEKGIFSCPDKVIGIANCHPDDEFNEEKGKEIALSKLNKNIVRNRENAVTRFEKYILKQVSNPAAKKKY